MDETRKTQGEEAHEETRSRKSKKKRSGIGGIVNAVLVIAVIGIIAFFAIKRLTKAPEELETRALPIVTLTSATTGSVEEQSAVMGTVNPSDTYYVMPKVAGELLEVYVENGQAVKQGDPIAKIDNQKQIDAAKSTLDAANAGCDSAGCFEQNDPALPGRRYRSTDLPADEELCRGRGCPGTGRKSPGPGCTASV